MPPKNRLTTAALLASLALAQLAWAGGARRTPEEYAKVDDFVTSPLEIYVHTTLDRMRSFDKVLGERSRAIANAHYPNKKDDVRSFEYDGLTLTVVFVGGNPTHGLLVDTKITGRRWGMKHGLRVGSTVTDILLALGEPDERSAEQLKYCGDATCGVFYLSGDRVAKAVFSSSAL